MNLARSMVVAVLAITMLLVACQVALAQEPIDSTTDLKRACEAGNHQVYVTVDMKINSGPDEDVASGCKISLGPVASFEADHVSMRFAGRFEIYSARERSVTFTSSVLKAPSLGFFGGDVGAFKSYASLLEATNGGIQIISGHESAVQVQNRPTASLSGLRATGSIFITGSTKLFVSLRDVGIEGSSGARIHLSGQGSELKADHAEVTSRRGPVSISSLDPTVVVELKRVELSSGGGNTTVSLGGSHSLVTTTLTHISSRTGSVDVRAGGQAWYGAVAMDETTVEAAGSVRVQGSPGGELGTAKIVNSTFAGGADIVLRTRTRGTTEVKESAISSGTAIRILTGANGACKAESNVYEAPVRRICP